ncbi:MAG TPA: lytic transglycosylase domain-containing protein [Candidatus Acetothermia bacterium]|nr:lytic transglycosylase domain-containing protein [Candidatus Acetothermia bacterium]
MMRRSAYRSWIVWGTIGLVLVAGVGLGATILYPLRYEGMITDYSTAQGLDPYLVFGVIRAESRFRARAVSPAGAIGLMQITPATGEWIAGKIGMTGFTPTDLYEPETNVRFGTWYLRYLLDRFSGDVATALLAYNAGPGAAERWAKGNEGVYPETAAYLEAVQRAERAYRALYSLPAIGWFLRLLSG